MQNHTIINKIRWTHRVGGGEKESERDPRQCVYLKNKNAERKEAAETERERKENKWPGKIYEMCSQRLNFHCFVDLFVSYSLFLLFHFYTACAAYILFMSLLFCHCVLPWMNAVGILIFHFCVEFQVKNNNNDNNNISNSSTSSNNNNKWYRYRCYLIF